MFVSGTGDLSFSGTAVLAFLGFGMGRVGLSLGLGTLALPLFVVFVLLDCEVLSLEDEPINCLSISVLYSKKIIRYHHIMMSSEMLLQNPIFCYLFVKYKVRTISLQSSRNTLNRLDIVFLQHHFKKKTQRD